MLDEAGVFEEGRLCPINYITLGTPHLGTLKVRRILCVVIVAVVVAVGRFFRYWSECVCVCVVAIPMKFEVTNTGK